MKRVRRTLHSTLGKRERNWRDEQRTICSLWAQMWVDHLECCWSACHTVCALLITGMTCPRHASECPHVNTSVAIYATIGMDKVPTSCQPDQTWD